MLFAHMLDGFALHEMLFDAEGNAVDYRFLKVNPAFEEITGLSAKNIIGRTVREVLPDTEPQWIENYGKVAVTGEPLRFEFGHATLSKIFDVRAYRPQEGQFACIFRDITERKRRETEITASREQIRKSAEEYREIFENTVEGIFRTSAEGRVLSANPALVQMLGYDCDADLAGMLTTQIYADPDEREEVLRLVEQGLIRGHECRLRRRDGKIIWVSVSCRKVLAPDGQTAYYVGFIADITSRKDAEEKLRLSENKFKMAFMTGADASTISTLEDGVLLEVNDRFADLFGYSREEVCGRHSVEVGWFAPGDRNRLISELTAHGQVENMEFQMQRKDGESRSMLVSASPLQGDGRKLLLSVVRDITEQKRAEAERTKLEEQFRQAQKLESVGRLAGGIAHDFNNQLTVINGYSDLLLRACKTGDPLRDWIEEIHKAGDQAVNLIRQLLAFSRKQALDPKAVHLQHLIHENESMLQRLIGEEIELGLESDPSVWPVFADPGQLLQVLMNLAVNARDAMPQGGTLTIRTANVEANAGAAYVSLRVTDTGTGIAKEVQDRIFDPFFTTKAEGVGTGLGLSTVYGIVTQLGGSISVSSEPGSGAAFEILLPRCQDESLPLLQSSGTSASGAGSETVLVVEDQEPVRKLTVLALKGLGYHVLEAADGTGALQIASCYQGPIHLLLTDVIMPHMTGDQLAGSFRSLRPDMKVLFMSGYTAEVLTRRGLIESGGAFIAKPFAPHALASRIRELLGVSAASAAILVVDDEAGVRGFFEQVLLTAGYDVEVAEDGEQALQMVRAKRFDLLLTDLVMPSREGLELILVLRKEQPDLKVVAVSGAFGGTFLEAARMIGARSVLPKPVSPADLLAAVQGVLA